MANIRNNAAWKAYGYRAQGLADAASANDYDSQGANDLGALPYGIGSSLLGGAKSIADKWKDAFGTPSDSSSTGDYLDYGGVPGPAF